MSFVRTRSLEGVATKDMETLFVSSRREWRRWLEKNHRARKEIWLVYDRRGSGGRPLSCRDFLSYAVEEAICYGSIDSMIKGLDESRSVVRFTPRRSSTNWSKYNKARALKMIRDGKMTSAGLTVLPPEWWKQALV